jgi:hypothetical protein
MYVYNGNCVLHKIECGGIKQNSVTHDYNTHHTSDIQSQFCEQILLKKA